jgi:two-component system, LytTR family, sensor kinase
VTCCSPLLYLAATPITDTSLIEKSFHLGVGAVLSALLLILALRSTGENRAACIGFAGCALTFTVAACIEGVARCFSQLALISIFARNLAFCAAAAWPLSILSMWSHVSRTPVWRRKLGQVVFVLAATSAVILSLACITGVLPYELPHLRQPGNRVNGLELAAYNGFLFFWIGAAVHLLGRRRSRLAWISTASLLIGVTLAALHEFEERLTDPPQWFSYLVTFAKPFSILFIVGGGLGGFSSFRFSDIFAQKGLRILLGALLALVCSFFARGIFGPGGEVEHSRLQVLGFGLVVWIAIICYARIAVLSDWLVDRQIFRQADYQRALKSFRETIVSQSDPTAIFNTAQELVQNTLRIADATVWSNESTFDHGYTREHAFPIQKGEKLNPFYLVISPGPRRHTLFNAEIDFLREVCLAIGRRLEGIDSEKEHIERARREAQLLKQLVEAELRALRAQVNPHFLFNSLNSVAALISMDPMAAEEMIVRLAKIFRCVLTYHDRPFSSIEEEISFLQTYLEIEKVRFGDRLQVNFDVQQSVTRIAVPSLILQPLVENSIKHGLGPKVGENRLTITARRQLNFVELTVEDNGVGANFIAKKPEATRSTGLGLRNVEERLQTVYGGHAKFSFESQPRVGSRAQILIPIPSAV